MERQTFCPDVPGPYQASAADPPDREDPRSDPSERSGAQTPRPSGKSRQERRPDPLPAVHPPPRSGPKGKVGVEFFIRVGFFCGVGIE
jgi:hypothetical protein